VPKQEIIYHKQLFKSSTFYTFLRILIF